MTEFTATEARQNWFQLVRKSAKGHVPVRITSKDGDVVLISEEDYESLLETWSSFLSQACEKASRSRAATSSRAGPNRLKKFSAIGREGRKPLSPPL